MRYLFITNIVSPNTVHLFNELHKDGKDIFVLYTRKHSSGRKYDNFSDVRHPHRILKEIPIKHHLYLNYELRAIIKHTWRADCVILGQMSNPTYLLSAIVGKLLGRKVIYWSEPITQVAHEENPIITTCVGKVFRKFVVQTYRILIDEVWPIGAMALRSLKKENFRHPHKLFYYYTDLSLFFDARNRPPEPKTKFVFVFTGSLTYRKGFDLILAAGDLLAAAGHDCLFEIYGEGPLQSERHNFIYHGFSRHDEIARGLERADLFLFPSRYDGWGVALIEALAAGVPVITSCNVGASEAIASQHDGIVLKRLTPDTLFSAITSLMRFPCKSAQTGLSAHRWTAKSGSRDFTLNTK